VIRRKTHDEECQRYDGSKHEGELGSAAGELLGKSVECCKEDGTSDWSLYAADVTEPHAWQGRHGQVSLSPLRRAIL